MVTVDFLKLKQVKTILFCRVGGGAESKVCKWDSVNFLRKAQDCIEDKDWGHPATHSREMRPCARSTCISCHSAFKLFSTLTFLLQTKS